MVASHGIHGHKNLLVAGAHEENSIITPKGTPAGVSSVESLADNGNSEPDEK
jgi:hypothetical protein